MLAVGFAFGSANETTTDVALPEKSEFNYIKSWTANYLLGHGKVPGRQGSGISQFVIVEIQST